MEERMCACTYTHTCTHTSHIHIHAHTHTSQRGSSSLVIQSKQEADMNLLRGLYTEEQDVAKPPCHQLRV